MFDFLSFLPRAGMQSVPLMLGSRSTYLKTGEGGYHGRKLEAGDILSVPDVQGPRRDLSRHYGGNGFYALPEQVIRVIPGPQDDHFTEKGLETFFGQAYTVTAASDRMGMRLDGPAIEAVDGYDIISDGINMGAVQVASGKPIIMLSDRQTTGGYAKIANVISVDLKILAQLKAGDRIRFRSVSVEEAQDLLIREAEALEGFERWLSL